MEIVEDTAGVKWIPELRVDGRQRSDLTERSKLSCGVTPPGPTDESSGVMMDEANT